MGVVAAVGAIAGAVADAVAAVGATFAAVGGEIAAGIGLTDATLGGITAGTIIGGGLEGAAIGGLGGAVIDAATGKPILPGLAEGALTGAAVGGLGPAIGGITGLGTTAGDVLAGAGAGAAGSALEGQNALSGAVTGGAGGLASGLIAGGAAPGAASGSPTAGGPGASAAGVAAPASVPDVAALPDPTAIPGAVGGGGISPADQIAATTGLSTAPAAYSGTGANASLTGTELGGNFAPGTGTVAGATAGAPAGTPPGGGAAPFVGLSSDASAAINPDTGAPIYSPSDALGGAVAGGGDTTGFGDINPANAAAIQAGVYPVPPVPPLNGVSGEYATLGDAAAAGEANAITTAGGIYPDLPAVGTGASPAGVGQSLGIGPSAGTLGYEINPALGTNPYVPAGAGPGGAYTLAQGATAGAPVDSPGFFSKAGSYLAANPALGLGGALIGYDLLKGNQVPKGENAISNTATELGQQATQLQSYLTSGTLPPGVQTALTQAGAAAKAAIRSQFAAAGNTGSSAETAALANVDNTIVAQGVNIATNLLSQGVSEANLATGLYGEIMQTSLTEDAQLSSALGTLAAAAARPTTVTLSGATPSG